MTINGLQTAAYNEPNLAATTKVDATTAQFLVPQSVDQVAEAGGGDGICWSGGEILGQFPPTTSWNTMHDKYGMLPGHEIGGNGIQIENVTIFSYGDGISFDQKTGPINNWAIRNVHIKYGRDDCVENDAYWNGTIESTFLDGCYTTVSARSTNPPSGRDNNVITISNSLLRLQSMDSVFSNPPPNHNAFWKWDPVGGPKVALYNNVFRADGPSKSGTHNGDYMAPPPGKLLDCQNNVMVWLATDGNGNPLPFPETLPTCFTLMTGTAGLNYWNNAVAQWTAAHPNPLPDVAPPIVSLFDPSVSGSPLTGTETLVATAVDDRAVTSVQFRLNGQNIGSPVTQDGASGDGATGPTKYRLSWDSRTKPNGTYTLTAVAQDAAGHSTTSAGVTVTVSN